MDSDSDPERSFSDLEAVIASLNERVAELEAWRASTDENTIVGRLTLSVSGGTISSLAGNGLDIGRPLGANLVVTFDSPQPTSNYTVLCQVQDPTANSVFDVLNKRPRQFEVRLRDPTVGVIAWSAASQGINLAVIGDA